MCQGVRSVGSPGRGDSEALPSDSSQRVVWKGVPETHRIHRISKIYVSARGPYRLLKLPNNTFAI